MQAPTPLLQRLSRIPGMGTGHRRLVLLFPQLGDFDSLEYAQALAAVMPQLEAAAIRTLAIGIGDADGAERFCAFTGFPRSALQVEPQPDLHRALGLYEGLRTAAGPWVSLLLMCAGFGSPGTLAEVLRGYTGDRSAPQRIDDDASVRIGSLPALPGALFRRAGGGCQRPFELATLRLRNMVEVLGHWRIYVPRDDFLTQRGGTFLLEADDSLMYCHRDRGLLGFSETMSRPLGFLEPYLVA